jgi:hypothetical protein
MEQNKKILFDLPDLAFVTGLPDKVANAYRSTDGCMAAR